MKIYLAGPMRNLPNNNFEAFKSAAYTLRKQGHEVFSPAEWDEKIYGEEREKSKDFDIRRAFSMDVGYVAGVADAIAMLPGWEYSTGAQAEWCCARAMGLKFIYL